MTGIDAMLHVVGIMCLAALGFALLDGRRRQAQPEPLSDNGHRNIETRDGHPGFAGTHLPVEKLVRCLKGGQNVDESCWPFPRSSVSSSKPTSIFPPKRQAEC